MEALYHPMTQRQLAAVSKGAASFIFAGPPGSGRASAALAIARRLNCEAGGDDDCAICQNLKAGSFADMRLIDPGETVGIDDIQGLQQILSSRPFSSSTSRLIVVRADFGMTREAQNRLLKTLEEPPAQTILVIITQVPDQLLETVQSRSRIIRFIKPTASAMKAHLDLKLGAESAKAVMELGPESVGEAIRLSADETTKQQRQRDQRLASDFLGSSIFERLIVASQVKVRQQAYGLIELMMPLAASSRQLGAVSALEMAYRRLQANVAPRATLEALALEL